MRDTLKEGARGGDVRVLQTALNTLGGNIVVDGVFGDVTFHAVCDFQSAKRLEPDGVVGPKTWTAIDQELVRHALAWKALETDKLKIAGEKAVERALAMWKLDIYDPKKADQSQAAAASKQYIDDMIRSGLGWTWESTYDGDGDFEWCGAFAAACWIDVKSGLRETYFSSTYRLDRYASYRSQNGEANVGTGRLYCKLDESSTAADLTFEPRAGDILLIGPKGYGQHICLVESVKDGFFRTIEGNGNGRDPMGNVQHGVVKSKRPLGQNMAWCARRLIRPSVDDLR